MNSPRDTRRQTFDLLRALVGKEFKIRYKNTVLGFFWSLLNPVLFACVFYVAFRHVLKDTSENFFVFLLAGMFPWQWFANTVSTAPSTYLANTTLVKNVYLPRYLLPLASSGNHLIHFLMALIVSLTTLLIFGHPPTPIWLAGIPALLVVQFTIILGISLIISSLNVFFRDLEHLTAVIVNFLFFLTPILYEETSIPERWRFLFRFNPMAYVIPQWRDLVLNGRISWEMVGIGAAVGAGLMGVAVGLYRRLEWRFAEAL